MAVNKLIQELRLALEDDLVMYGVVLQIIRDCGADNRKRPITDRAYDAIVVLLTEGLAEIGDTRLDGDKSVGDVFSGRLEFDAWPGSLDEQKARLKRTIDEVGTDPGLGEGFWLAKPLPK
jgi:hypothetical protein